MKESVILRAWFFRPEESLYFVLMRDSSGFAYVYIMANDWQVLYTGVTTALQQRVQQHKEGRFTGSFSARYHLHKLVYYERFSTIAAAIAREKQIKGWRRGRKLELIVRENPAWKDLSSDWGKPIGRFRRNESEAKKE